MDLKNIYVATILLSYLASTIGTYVLNRWHQTNVVEYSLYIGSAKYTRASTPTSKTLLLTSIIITIILSYAIIRI